MIWNQLRAAVVEDGRQLLWSYAAPPVNISFWLRYIQCVASGRLNTSLITSSQPLMLLLAVFVYDLITWIVSLFLAADLPRTADGLLLSRWPDSPELVARW